MTSLSFSHSPTLSDSETETITSASGSTKKNQRQTPSTPSSRSNRSNCSHTTFFFRVEADNPNICYCKLCEIDLIGTNKTAHGYNRKGGNTSNLIAHLRD